MRGNIFWDFSLTRCGLLIIALAALVWLPGQTGPEYRHLTTNPFLDMWDRWDAAFFARIAQDGYSWQHGFADRDATFMPLYPVLIGLVVWFWPGATRITAIAAGVVLSNLFLLASLFYLDALLALDIADEKVRRLTRILFLVSPATIFFSGAYSESLFFLLSLMTVYYARRADWALAGLAGFLAAMTRVTGWSLVLLLAWEFWQTRRAGSPIRLLAVLAPLMAFPFYMSIAE